jgi:hypothetical protein
MKRFCILSSLAALCACGDSAHDVGDQAAAIGPKAAGETGSSPAGSSPVGSRPASDASSDATSSEDGMVSPTGMDMPNAMNAPGGTSGADATPGTTPGAITPTATATLVQHVSGSNLRNNSMASPFCYYAEIPAPATAGNAIVVGATWKGTAKLAVSDDQGDKYTTNETFHDATDNQSVGIASTFHATAGARKISVCFSADPGGWVQPMATEFAGVVSIDGSGSGASGSGSTATSAALTPGGSDLLYQVVYTPGAPPSSFGVSAGDTLLSADIRDGWAGQYGPATAGTPSIALGSQQHWVTAAILLRSGDAGGVPGGMRIVRLQHENLPQSTAAGGDSNADPFPNPAPLQFPTSGNLIVAEIAGGNGTSEPPAVTSIADGQNTWRSAQKSTNGDCMAQIWYAAKTSASPGLPISLTWEATDTDASALLYDVAGAADAPFDVANGGGGSGDAIGNLTLPFTLTPSAAGELVFVETPWDFNTGGGLVGKLLDANLVTGESESGPFPVDENNGWGHAFSTSTSPMSFTWTPYFGSLSFGTYAGAAAAFKAAP